MCSVINKHGDMWELQIQKVLNDEQLRVPFLVVLAKLQKVTVSFVMCVCPHATTWLALDGFS